MGGRKNSPSQEGKETGKTHCLPSTLIYNNGPKNSSPGRRGHSPRRGRLLFAKCVIPRRPTSRGVQATVAVGHYGAADGAEDDADSQDEAGG
mmetsp:Transcript_35542/g.79795  ORF Transcript_35542/g.79795 Transcript_35542/m.79795 type:complete len:92 (-) Transcript_35542:391-666(-)